MFLYKSVYFISVTIFLVFFCGKGTSDPLENVQFITKSEQKSSEDWEGELLEPHVLENGKIDLTRSEVGDGFENNEAAENQKLLFPDDEKEDNEKYDKEDVVKEKTRNVRQVNSSYSRIYPTLTPQNPIYPYKPAAGVYGNGLNNYPNNQNSYLNPGNSQPYYYPQGQHSLQNNMSYTNPGQYNQGSIYNQTYSNGPYPQYNQNFNQRYNSSIGPPKSSFQGNFPQYGNNANQNTFIPTHGNQWTPGYTNNNTRYNPSSMNGASPQNPYYNNPPNNFHNFNNSTPRTVINGLPSPSNPQYNPSNPSYQSYPHNSQQNNYNRSNQWSSSLTTQTPNNYPRNNYPAYIPSDGRSSNVSRQNYPSYNPSSYPTNNNPYNQQPYSPNPLPNQYRNNYPTGPNANYNNQYNKEPDHFFYSSGNKDSRYDPRNNPSRNFSYTQLT